MFEVSLRTIYRDIDAIDLAGIPIRTISGVNGGIEIMPKYKLDRSVFSTSDLSAILMGLSSLSSMDKGKDHINTLAKIKRLIPEDRVKEIELDANQILIDMSPWLGNRNIQPYLEIIKMALQMKRLLSFAYMDKQGHQSVRSIEPYQLVLKNGQWYVYGFCLNRDDFRTFHLSRMCHLQCKNEIFIPREYPKPQLKVPEHILKAKQTKIKLRIHESLMERFLEFCDFEAFVKDGQEHFLVDFFMIENDYYYDRLLGFGQRCECLEPAHVREECKRRIQLMIENYEVT